MGQEAVRYITGAPVEDSGRPDLPPFSAPSPGDEIKSFVAAWQCSCVCVLCVCVCVCVCVETCAIRARRAVQLSSYSELSWLAAPPGGGDHAGIGI